MRIIAGAWRGRPLVVPAGLATRPTADRLRGALFSMLQSRLGSFEGLAVADLFAGSGALGLEALSRGAERAVFVEQDRNALTALRRNIEVLGAGGTIQASDATTPGPAPFLCDLILMDPPYRSGLAAGALPRLVERGWVAPAALVSIETARGEDVPAPGFVVEVVREHGAGRLTLLRQA